jgi:surface antigen
MEPNETLRLKLMRLVDGELPAGEAAAVAASCRDDPAAGALIASLQAERALLRAAFPPSEAPAGRTLAVIDAAFAARRRRRRWPRLWSATMPLAASLLTAAIVGTWAVWLAEERAEAAAERVLAAQASDRALAAATMARALDTQVSGSTVTWRNPDSGSAGSVKPLRTFRTADGRWCREFEQRLDALTGQQGRGVACRGPAGWWLKLERPAGEA